MELIDVTKNQTIRFFTFIKPPTKRHKGNFEFHPRQAVEKTHLMRRIFNTAKCEYEDALKKSGFKVNCKYTKSQRQKPKNMCQNIIWFNPTFNQAVSTNIAKIFLWLIHRHFSKSHRLHKIFHENTVEVSYSCMHNMSKIYKGHNSKITPAPCNQLTLCNCREKRECAMDSKYQTTDAVYDCRVTSSEPQKIRFGLAKGK